MDEPTSKNPRKEAELSFQDLKAGITYFLALAAMILRFIRKILRRHFVLLLILFLLFTGWGIYRFYTQKIVYKGTASYVFTTLNKKVYGEMADKLEHIIAVRDYSLAAQRLHLPLPLVKEIRKLKAKNIYGAKLSEDISGDKVPFYITVTATDDSVFSPLQDALETYFNHNPLAMEQIRQKKNTLQQKIVFSKSELNKLDSIGSAYALSPEKYMTKGDNNFNPTTLFQKAEELNNNLAVMEAKLPDIKAVKLVNGFWVPAYSRCILLRPLLLRCLLYFVICSIVILTFLSIIKHDSKVLEQ